MLKYLVLFLLCTSLVSCEKNMFFEDTDDPGISRFTYRGYNVSSAYINGEAWVRPFYSLSLSSRPAKALAWLVQYPGVYDSLYVSFAGAFKTDGVIAPGGWRSYPEITFALPVKKNFTGADFLAMAGKRFPESGSQVRMWLGFGPTNGSGYPEVSGVGGIYFVAIDGITSTTTQKEFAFSGLFEGNIGDSIIVTKGRFDYHLRSDANNIP